MRTASYQHPSYLGRASRRSRVISALLTLALVAIVIALLIGLGVLPSRVPDSSPTLSTFNVTPAKQVAAARAPASEHKQHASSAKPPPAHPLPPPPVPMPVATPAPKMLTLSKDEFAATDIGKIKGHADEGAADGADDGKDSAAAYGPGEGPGGARLYNAQWYQEPTHAQLAYYMPPGTPTGTAIIACKTIADYHVENCRELGETPPGSGLARALRQAAWQFRVRPPRLGGKLLISAWVRIRFDFTRLGPE